ncbi:MAG: ATP-binding protein [Paludibacteraceae bacterium]|nr:ATP-binding protein [Paludibacteraceae bacterium]
MEYIFERKIYQQMLQWKAENQGKTALLIEGARRIGKSTIAEQFAKQEYKSYILIDFNKATNTIKNLFNDLMDLDFIFVYLQDAYKTNLYPRESVIIFDEVQQCPLARQAIKYLVQDGRYDYIETGSLISIRKNVENITIPSEEDKIEMFPMDYEEFRWAMGDKTTMPLQKQLFEKRMSMGDELNRAKMRDLRLYMLVGGMPQAVSKYLETKNLRAVDSIKRKIIELYIEDFRKIDKNGKIGRLFKAIPAMLSRNVTRFHPTSIIKGLPSDKMEDLIIALEESKTVNFCFHVADPQVGLPLTEERERFKLYVGDTGLMVTLAFGDKRFTENELYSKLLSDKLPANLGYVYENLVAQMLRAAGNELYYHTWPKDDNHNYEIDFLLSRGTKICPVEVKSSNHKSHVSLDEFCKKYSSRIANRYLLYTKDLRKDGEILMIPVYMTGLL